MHQPEGFVDFFLQSVSLPPSLMSYDSERLVPRCGEQVMLLFANRHSSWSSCLPQPLSLICPLVQCPGREETLNLPLVLPEKTASQRPSFHVYWVLYCTFLGNVYAEFWWSSLGAFTGQSITSLYPFIINIIIIIYGRDQTFIKHLILGDFLFDAESKIKPFRSLLLGL